MRTLITGSIAALLAFGPSRSQAQVPIVAGGGVEVAVTGRVQTQFNTSSVDEGVYSTFETRRARLGFALAIDGWITGKLEADFAHRVELEDAWVNLGFDPAFQLQVGQFKKPFSLIELTSSSRIIAIERGLRIRALPQTAEHYLLLDDNGYTGRELGAQVHGRVGALRYAAGVFNGSGANTRDVNDAKSYAARLSLRPFDSPFEIGAAASYRDRLTAVDDGPEPFETAEGLAVEVDVSWGGFRRPGPSVVLEVMQARNFATSDPMIGGQGIVGWFVPLGERVEGIEPLFRASYGDPSTEYDGTSGLLFTPGINLYFHGRNRLMLNWDHYRPEHDAIDAESAIRAQLQLFF